MARIAFIARNPFQATHIAALCRHMDGTLFGPADIIAPFTTDMKTQIHRGGWAKLDSTFDVIVAQGPAHDITQLRKAKTAFIQYGYAKAPYNFDGWRALADLNIAYGPYAAERFAHFAPALSLGHPRIEEAASDAFKDAALAQYGDKLAPEKPTLLYAPTWGDLSSFDRYAEAILALQSDYTVLLKLHHNTVAREAARTKRLEDAGAIMFGADDDFFSLMQVSDLVISDYSGAIFDAILLDKPVVLLNVDDKKLDAAKKIDSESLEMARRNALGTVVQTPENLGTAVETALESKASLEDMKKQLYATTSTPLADMARALNDLADGAIQPTQMQSYAMKYTRKQVHVAERNKRVGIIAIALAAIATIAALLAFLL